MQYERSITSGLEVMAKVKVFVHATDADADGRATALAPQTYLSQLAKKSGSKFLVPTERSCHKEYTHVI